MVLALPWFASVGEDPSGQRSDQGTERNGKLKSQYTAICCSLAWPVRLILHHASTCRALDLVESSRQLFTAGRGQPHQQGNSGFMEHLVQLIQGLAGSVSPWCRTGSRVSQESGVKPCTHMLLDGEQPSVGFGMATPSCLSLGKLAPVCRQQWQLCSSMSHPPKHPHPWELALGVIDGFISVTRLCKQLL